MQVDKVMSQHVLAVLPTEPIRVVFNLMKKRNIRHVPVTNKNGQLLGLITNRDLLAASASLISRSFTSKQTSIMNSVLVKEIMRTDIETTTADADVRDVARKMRRSKLGCMPVTEGKRLVGIVTESDFLTLSVNLLSMQEKLKSTIAEAD